MQFKPEKYAFIDSLRAIAILGVLMVHTSTDIFAPSSKWLLNITSNATYGVQLFYMVSAFTLFLSYNDRKANNNYLTFNFFIRRFFRIAPLFYLSIIIYLLLDGFAPRYWAPDGIKWWYIFTTATFTNGWYPTSITSVVPGGWSVAIEMNFYLLLPFFFKYITSLHRAVLFTLISLLINIVFGQIMLLVLQPLFPQNQQYLIFFFLKSMCLPVQMSVFCLGFILYFIFFILKKTFQHQSDKSKKLSCYLYLMVSFYIIFSILVSNVQLLPYELFPRPFIYTIAFLFFACALSIYPLPIFVNKITQKIGKVSYSMYLTHWIVIYTLKKISYSYNFPIYHDIQYFFYYILLIFFTYILSLLTYKFIEKPGIALGQKIIIQKKIIY